MADFDCAPPFDPQAALVSLRRNLRELRLRERGNSFEWNSMPIVLAQVQQQTLSIQLARRPLASPDFESIRITSSAQLRQLTEELKRRLSRWSDE